MTALAFAADASRPPERVALYARISRDSSGRALGVNDQLERGRSYADLKGFKVVAELHDNDISAFTGKHRPGYAQVAAMVRRGEVDAVIVYQLSRLTRNRVERAEFIDGWGAAGVVLHETQGAVYDLGTAAGRSFADMRGGTDTTESETKGERIRSSVERRVKVGGHASHPGYGWTRDLSQQDVRGEAKSYVLHAEQAAVVRELAKAVAAGRPLRRLAIELNEREVPPPGAVTPTGRVPKRPAAEWSALTIKQILARKSNIGIYVHHRGLSDEAEFKGNWPAILTEAAYAKANRRLSANKGKGKAAPRTSKRVHLLSGGVAFCGVCGATFTVGYRTNASGTTTASYRCSGGGGCTQRRVEHLDAFARDALVARLSQPDALAWMAGDKDEASAATEELAALQQRADDAATAYGTGAISIQQLTRINEQLNPKIDAAKQRKSDAHRHLDVDLLSELAGPRATTNWDRMDVAQKRLALEAIGLRIDVNKSKPSGKPLTELDQSTVRLSFGMG